MFQDEKEEEGKSGSRNSLGYWFGGAPSRDDELIVEDGEDEEGGATVETIDDLVQQTNDEKSFRGYTHYMLGIGEELGCQSLGGMCYGNCPPGTQCGSVAGTCLCTL